MNRVRTALIVICVTFCAAGSSPGGRSANALRGSWAGRHHHTTDRLLPRRLDARLPAGAGPEHAAVRERDRAASSADRQLDTFLVDRIEVAIRRANTDLAPAEAAWGHAELIGVTQNRSLEAHLANFGVNDPTYGSGNVSQDPGGYVDTIDPSVDVLRVDKLLERRVRCSRCVRRSPPAGVATPRCVRTADVPIGAWSTFADHGTVVHSSDLTSRPPAAAGGTVTFLVGARTVIVRSRSATTFDVPAPARAPLSVAAGGARDAFGNTNSRAVSLRSPG